MRKPPVIAVEYIGDIAVATAAVDLNTDDTIQRFGDALLRLISEESCRRLLLDLSETKGFSSAMIGKLIAINRRMSEVGGLLVVYTGRNEGIWEALDIMKLGTVLTIETERFTALRRF